MNLPPHIASEFVSPPEAVLRVESSDHLRLSVDTLLDPNPEEALYYAFIGDRSGIIEQATSTRQPSDEQYRDTFYLFEQAQVQIDPCSERLRPHADELIRLVISDRPFQRVTDRGVEIADEAMMTNHYWLLRFRAQLCP